MCDPDTKMEFTWFDFACLVFRNPFRNNVWDLANDINGVIWSLYYFIRTDKNCIDCFIDKKQTKKNINSKEDAVGKNVICFTD